MRDTIGGMTGGAWRRLSVAAGVLLVGLGLAVWGASSSSGATRDSSVAGRKVVLVSCGDANAWCKVYNATILAGLEKAGVKTQYLQDPFDPTLQVQHLQSAIAEHPALILVVASADDSIVPSLLQAKAAGVPVINLNDRPAAAAVPLVVASIEGNQTELGKAAAENIVAGLKAEGKAKGNVIAITGATATHTSADRMAAFDAYIGKYPQYKIVSVQDGNWDPVLTAKIATQLFAQYQSKGGIAGAYGMADYQATAIVQAAVQAGLPVGVKKKGLIVTGSNCFKAGIQDIENGTMYGTSTQAPVTEGNYVVPFVLKYLSGKAIPKVDENTEYDVTPKDVKTYAAECSKA
jgi:ABC-type sugar transport system substrate-binding protein